MVALVVESWIWWSLVIIIATSRFISRRMTLGSFRKYQADDYLMVVALCFYTTLIVSINIVRNENSNLLPPGFDVHDLTKQDVSEREYGSKLILVVEQCQCATIWLVKACILILYLRLTVGHRENVAIKVLIGYIVLTFVVMDILYFGVWCQPFHDYWAVPTPNYQCSAATHHLIVNASFNLSSDLIMLGVGLPMFLRLNLPLKKKIPVVGIFSLGVFTILAAILNKVYSFTEPFGAAWTYWYTRESSTALLVANLPFVWALWRKLTFSEDTVHGLSRQASYEPRGTRSVNEKAANIGTSSFKVSPMRSSSASSDDIDMELGGSSRGPGFNSGITLAEILREETSSAANEKEPTPYTHPQLFYGKKGRSFGDSPQARFEKAVLSDSPEQETKRRDSDPDTRVEKTPVSSTFQSGNSGRSVESIV